MLKNISKKISAMTLREKILVCLVGVVLFVFPGYFSIIEPILKDNEKLNSSIKMQQEDLENKNNEFMVLQARMTKDPNLILNEEIKELESKIEALDNQFNKETTNLIDATQMSFILSSLLSSSDNLSLISINSVPPVLLIQKDDVSLYQHGIVIKLRGKYLDVLNYLNKVEKEKNNFYWSKIEYKVDVYPYAIVEIGLFTLSINKDFIRG